MRERIVNLDADPLVPYGWEIKEHRRMSACFEWDASKVAFYVSEGQKEGKSIQGTVLREEIAGIRSYNANLLDYLLKNQSEIPEGWKGIAIVFWGTIYMFEGRRVVRALYYYGPEWRDIGYFLDPAVEVLWHGGRVAAIPK